MSNRRVLVVGTTPDYVDIICRRFPGRALFLTDTRVRAAAAEAAPGGETELLCDLEELPRAQAALVDFLARQGVEPSGIACFDCESMPLASVIAGSLSLDYPSPESVAACRNKLVTRQLWAKEGLPCPETGAAEDGEEALRIADRLGWPVVVKPLTGSGGDLVSLCRTEEECLGWIQTLRSRLAAHADARMYAVSGPEMTDPRSVFGVEAYVEGPEYSCDFMVRDGCAEVIRLARKVPARQHAFGTALAYLVPAQLPREVDPQGFRRQLCRAADVLGLKRAVCMLDFVISGGRAVMLEMAPRPGGDCVPPLLLRSSGLDMLGYALDFAERRTLIAPEPSSWQQLVGLRLLAERSGAISEIDAEPLRRDHRVVECLLTRSPGHRVVMPPDDCDSRLLGYAIFRPSAPGDIEGECTEISGKLRVEYDAGQSCVGLPDLSQNDDR